MRDVPQDPAPTTRDPASLAEIAAVLGVSRQRVQQIEERALRKLRVLLQARGLTLDDLIRSDHERAS